MNTRPPCICRYLKNTGFNVILILLGPPGMKTRGEGIEGESCMFRRREGPPDGIGPAG